MINTHTEFTVAPTLHIETSPKKWAARLLAWIVAKDRAYKDRQHFKSLSDETLKDVGLYR